MAGPVAFPRLPSRGPIEGVGHALRSERRAGFPRLPSRGPIEGPRLDAVTAGMAAFHDSPVVAPLKAASSS